MPTYRYHCSACFKTHIGSQLPGTMACNCNPARQIVGQRVIVPLSDALKAQVSPSQAATLRNTLCQRWGITNQSHGQHGANFSSNQTVANLINDIVNPVQGQLRSAVKTHVLNDYGYDIDAREMAG